MGQENEVGHPEQAASYADQCRQGSNDKTGWQGHPCANHFLSGTSAEALGGAAIGGLKDVSYSPLDPLRDPPGLGHGPLLIEAEELAAAGR